MISRRIKPDWRDLLLCQTRGSNILLDFSKVWKEIKRTKIQINFTWSFHRKTLLFSLGKRERECVCTREEVSKLKRVNPETVASLLEGPIYFFVSSNSFLDVWISLSLSLLSLSLPLSHLPPFHCLWVQFFVRFTFCLRIYHFILVFMDPRYC